MALVVLIALASGTLEVVTAGTIRVRVAGVAGGSGVAVVVAATSGPFLALDVSLEALLTLGALVVAALVSEVLTSLSLEALILEALSTLVLPVAVAVLADVVAGYDGEKLDNEVAN